MIKCVINCSTNLDSSHVFFFFKFWLCWVFVAARRGFFSCSTQASLLCALECTGLVVAVPRLSCSVACGILVPWPGIKPMSPALECRFPVTRPSGKFLPTHWEFYIHSLSSCWWSFAFSTLMSKGPFLKSLDSYLILWFVKNWCSFYFWCWKINRE